MIPCVRIEEKHIGGVTNEYDNYFGVALLIIICGYAYAKYRDEKDHNAIYTYMEDAENDNSETLQKNDYINLTRYNDDKADSRTDAILSVLDKIHFWVMIIGIYILVKIIAAIIVLYVKVRLLWK